MFSNLILRFRLTMYGEYLVLLFYGFYYPNLHRSGATKLEKCRPLPDEDIISKSTFQKTCNIAKNSPAIEIWFFLVQKGADRAVWYTWFPLINHLIYGVKGRYLIRILHKFQHLKLMIFC